MSTSADSRERLDLLLQEASLPGIAWAMIGDDTASSGGHGYAELSSARPMTADTKVQVGSVTKTLVALGVLQLVSSGKITLDADVEHLLPELNWNNRWRDTTPVTVQHLLEHTAGLDNIRMWQFLNSAATPDTPLKNAFPPGQEHLLRVRTQPGSQYSYSNMGYAILGLVIERISLQRYEDYLARELLEPLGMLDSSFHLITQAQDSRLAMGYLDGGVPQTSVPMYLRPAGQYTTTANDMLRLLHFMLGDGSVDGVVLVEPQYLARLGRPSTTEAYRAGLSIGHGLALAARDRHGVVGDCHPGTTFGFQAYLCLFPDEGKAFFYAINADHENADYERFTRYFIERLDVASQAAAPTIRGSELDAYTGLYALSPSNMAQFAWLDWMFNSLWLGEDRGRSGIAVHSLQQPGRLLLPLGGGLFRDAERRVASHVFFGDGNMMLSNGLTTWRRASLTMLCLGWLSLLTGVLGLLYILLRGAWLLLQGGALANNGLLIPWLCLVAFAFPVYLFTQQAFLQFGERTSASMLLAALTGFLPLALSIALIRFLRGPKPFLFDLLAVIAGLQLCLVFLLQGVLPVMFWR